jgi:hypothetical protein
LAATAIFSLNEQIMREFDQPDPARVENVVPIIGLALVLAVLSWLVLRVITWSHIIVGPSRWQRLPEVVAKSLPRMIPQRWRPPMDKDQAMLEVAQVALIVAIISALITLIALFT